MAAEEIAGTGVTINAVSSSIIHTLVNRTAMPTADISRVAGGADIARHYVFEFEPELGAVAVPGIPHDRQRVQSPTPCQLTVDLRGR